MGGPKAAAEGEETGGVTGEVTDLDVDDEAYAVESAVSIGVDFILELIARQLSTYGCSKQMQGMERRVLETNLMTF